MKRVKNKIEHIFFSPLPYEIHSNYHFPNTLILVLCSQDEGRQTFSCAHMKKQVFSILYVITHGRKNAREIKRYTRAEVKTLR